MIPRIHIDTQRRRGSTFLLLNSTMHLECNSWGFRVQLLGFSPASQPLDAPLLLGPALQFECEDRQSKREAQKSSAMTHLLIVDDDLKDLRSAYEIARSVGFADIEGRTSYEQARHFLEAALMGKCLMPDAIIIDLLLGKESGFELLRYCYSNPNLASIPVVVWTILGEEQRELCSLFKVRSFVTKQEDYAMLRDALRKLQT